jgi:hypothetical protein
MPRNVPQTGHRCRTRTPRSAGSASENGVPPIGRSDSGTVPTGKPISSRFAHGSASMRLRSEREPKNVAILARPAPGHRDEPRRRCPRGDGPRLDYPAWPANLITLSSVYRGRFSLAILQPPSAAEPGSGSPFCHAWSIKRFQSRFASPKWIPRWSTVSSDNLPTITSTGQPTGPGGLNSEIG